jgi:tRNA-2-methylthio-N6-dimethylallyladenosine synthase
MRKFYIKTFGCQMNVRDSEIIEQLLRSHGHHPVMNMEDADLILLNTCSIRDKAEQKVFSLLGQLREQIRKTNTDCILGVAGCVAQQEQENICKRMPDVRLVVGTQQFYQLPDMIDRLESGLSTREISCDLVSDFTIPPFQQLFQNSRATENTTAPCPAAPGADLHKQFVTIMQGCNNFCSYCVVPHTRGREISRPVADILDEVRYYTSMGIREITLLGQNVNSYGTTNQVADQPVDFADLLYMVAEIPGINRIRFTSSNPHDLSDKLMQCFKDIQQLCPHFHLPVQSGSNKVLSRMNRKYTRELYLEKVAGLRQACPGIALSTDIIVGFPGEDEQDFAQTMDLLETVRFHASFSFKYSDRPHTRSASFAEKVDEQTKTERLAIFQKRQDQISLERNQELVGTSKEIMVEQVHEKGVQGRTGSNHIVHLESGSGLECGDFAVVTITRAGMHSLQGRLKTLP